LADIGLIDRMLSLLRSLGVNVFDPNAYPNLSKAEKGFLLGCKTTYHYFEDTSLFCQLLQSLPESQIKEVPKIVQQFVMAKTIDQRKALIKSIGDQKQVRKVDKKLSMVTVSPSENVLSVDTLLEDNAKQREKLNTRRTSFSDKMGQLPYNANETNKIQQQQQQQQQNLESSPLTLGGPNSPYPMSPFTPLANQSSSSSSSETIGTPQDKNRKPRSGSFHKNF